MASNADDLPTGPHVRVRPATVADITVLREWDEDPDVAASGGEDGGFDWDLEVPRNVAWREFLIAELDGEPIGFLQLIDALEEETHYWGSQEQPGTWAIDIWIGAARHRRGGHGTEMMRLALDRCFGLHGASTVLIDPLESNTRAHGFYERIGFRFVEHRWFDTDHCRVYEFPRANWHP